ncbi:hypothetical protein B5X24_HaOG203882 [Helicoverpa armigera]|nr:hypothetical protein B5X24_HaOG203882 [Helicoverpa armigera]
MYVIFIHLSFKTEQDRSRKRRRDEVLQVRRNSTENEVPTEKVKESLREEITDVLDEHGISPGNKEKFLEDMICTLNGLATGNGDFDRTKLRCSRKLRTTGMSLYQVEEVSDTLVSRAREISLIIKTVDSKESYKNRIDRANENKSSHNNVRFAQSARVLPIERLSEDAISMKPDTTVQQHQLKEKLLKNITNVISTAGLSPDKKRDLKIKLSSLVEKQFSNPTFSEKHDLASIKRVLLKDTNEALEKSAIPKNKKYLFKYKLAQVLNETLLVDEDIRKTVLLKNVDDLIANLPISGNEKSDLKHCLAHIYEETNSQDLPTPSKLNVQTNTAQDLKFKRVLATKSHFALGKTDSFLPRLSKIEEKVALHTSLSQSSPFNAENTSNEPSFEPDQAELDYLVAIENVIKAWLVRLPVPLDVNIQASIAEKMAQDLVDRKKYLQISTAAKPTFKDDLDYLKLQVHRRMNKFVKSNVLTAVIHHLTEGLQRNIDNIKVPVMNIPPGFADWAQQPAPSGAPLTSTQVLQSIATQYSDQDTRPTRQTSKEFQSVLPKLDIDQSLREEIHAVLDNHKINPVNRKEIEDNVLEDLRDFVVTKGVDPDATKKKLVDTIIPEANLSRKRASDVASDLIDRARELALLARANDSDVYLKRRALSQSSRARLADMTSDNVLDSPEKLKLGDPNIYTIDGVEYNDENAIKEALRKKVLAGKLRESMSQAVTGAVAQSSIPEGSKTKLAPKIINKIDADVEKSPLKTKKDVDLLKDLALNDSKEIIDETLIPPNEKNRLKSLLTEAFSKDVGVNDLLLVNEFVPTRTSTPKKSVQLTKDPAGSEYTNKIADTIKKWSKTVPLHLDPIAEQNFIEDLSSDILDRQNYLRLHPKEKYTDNDEIETLKFQIYSGLHDDHDTGVLLPVLDKADALHAMLKEIEVPQDLPKSRRNRNQKDGQDGGSTRPTAKELEEIRKKMNGEIGDILANCGLDEKEREALQASLGNELERLAKSGATPEEMRRALIEKIKKESNMTDEEAEQLADKLLGVAKNLSLASKFQGAARPSVNRTSQMRDRPSQSQKRDSSKQRRDSYPSGKSRDISAARRWPCCGKSPVQRKDFQEAMLRELGDVFHGCPMSEEKRKLMERQLAEQYARELGIPLEDGDFSEDRKLDPVITATVNDWVRALPITITTNQEDNDLENDKLELITRLNEIIPTGDFSKVNGEVHRFMQRVPLDPELKNDEEFMNKKSRELIDNLISGARRRGSRYGMSFNGLTDYIEAWLNNLHIDDPTKGEEQMKDMKKDMAYNLVHKIGEMNVDPEIFNDNLLYEDVLRDEIENMLAGVTITDPNLQELKDELVAKALEARRRAHDEMVGQNYKQNLRDTISNMLPDQRNMSYDEQASLEILKDQLADAFINLHYSGNDDNLRGQIKRKISSEIAAFCNNYMRRHPGIPLNSQKLNYDLYTALNDVPLPCGDSMRYEVEQARIREEIDEWVRDLPLEPQSAAELLARNKMVYVLSKKIFDIEVEADDKVELMRKRILEFLNKMPVRPSENLNALAERLIDKLNATELYRRFSESANVTIDAFGNAIPSPGPPCTNAPNSPTCPYFKTRMNLLPSSPCTRTFQSDRTVEHTPPRRTFPCTLSPEDMAHLERIRRRACLSPKCVSSLLKNKRNAAVGPKPVDTESQTDIRANAGPVCPTNDDRQPRPCPGVQTSTSRASGIQTKNRPTSSCNMQTEGEVDPQIIVKEFYWDSPDNSKRMPCHQTGPQPYQQPATGPCNLSGTAPCQSSYYPPSGSPYQQSGSPYQLSPPLQQPGASLYPRTSPGPSTLSGTSSYLPSAPPCHQMGTSPFQSFSHRPPHQTGRSPSHPPSRPPCHPPSHPSSRSPCHRSSSPHYTPGSFSSHQNYLSPQASPTHQGQSISAQRMPCDFSSYKAPHSHRESCSQWSSRGFDDRTSRRSSPCSRSPPASPHLSPFSSPFGPNHQSTPLNSPGYSCRLSDSRMQKRDGLQDQIPCTSSRQSRRERVIELGSLDDLRHPRPSKKRNSNNWSSKCSDEENSWGSPVMRRVILDEGIDEQRMMERELGQGQREERVKCKCKDRLSLKSTRSQTFHTQCATTTSEEGHNSNHLTRCSKCCGLHCPYPSFLYFRE